MKLFVDDVRQVPDGWVVARTVDEAKSLLARENVEVVSLDHDMGACAECAANGLDIGDMTTPETTFMHWCSHAADGYALVKWMLAEKHVPPVVHVHTMNPVGRKRMLSALERGC